MPFCRLNQTHTNLGDPQCIRTCSKLDSERLAPFAETKTIINKKKARLLGYFRVQGLKPNLELGEEQRVNKARTRRAIERHPLCVCVSCLGTHTHNVYYTHTCILVCAVVAALAAAARAPDTESPLEIV